MTVWPCLDSRQLPIVDEAELASYITFRPSYIRMKYHVQNHISVLCTRNRNPTRQAFGMLSAANTQPVQKVHGIHMQLLLGQ
jgi:hypothetical protein